MPSFLRPNRVVILTKGRYAGKKAVIVRAHERGTTDRPYGHAVVAGIERYPLKVTKDMIKKKAAKRSRVFPFVKKVNFTHLMPTRYNVDVELKPLIGSDTLRDPAKKQKALRNVRRLFQQRYQSGQDKWFFQKLPF